MAHHFRILREAGLTLTLVADRTHSVPTAPRRARCPIPGPHRRTDRRDDQSSRRLTAATMWLTGRTWPVNNLLANNTLVLPASLDIQVRARVTLGQIADDCATRDLRDGFRGTAGRNPRMPSARARCCLMARGAIKVISPVPDHRAGPRRLSGPQRHEKYCSAKASAAANPGCRCPRSRRT
jgi:hypothetical protein